MATAETQLIKEGFRQAEQITKRYAKTFYFASLFLPKATRQASYAVYAICRQSDDSVDTNSTIPSQKALEEIEQNIASAYTAGRINTPLIASFRQTIKTYGIPQRYFDELIAGMRMDLTKQRYETFEELSAYCYKVAGVIGLIMLRIFGSKEEKAEQYAVDLGIAMQLTNIIRDIKEDLQRNRIYLPQQELRQFSVNEADLNNGIINEQFKTLLKFQIERARIFYNNSEAGIRFLSPKRTRLVTRIMKTLYAGILTALEKNRYEIFKKRVHVPLWKKISLSLRILASNTRR